MFRAEAFIVGVLMSLVGPSCDRPSDQPTTAPAEAPAPADDAGSASEPEQADSGSDVGKDDEDVWGGLTKEEVEEAYGTGDGGLGVSDGSGGAGFGGRGKRVPRVRLVGSSATGLDKDIVRRIVRAHVNEVRACYTEGLDRDDKIGGEIEITFAIAADGKAKNPKVVKTTLADDEVTDCITKAMSSWKFPKPTGKGSGTQKFSLSPG